MKIINARTPYFVTVDELNQVGSKIEIFIWNEPNTAPDTSPNIIPSTANYSLSKKIASFTQRANTYNISSFIQEYIDNIVSTNTTDLNYANVYINVYKEVSAGSYSLTRVEEYVGVNGFNTYLDGANKINTNEIITLLSNNLKVVNYNRLDSIPFVNVFIDSVLGDTLELNYTDKRGRNLTNTILISDTDAARKELLKIPLSTSSIKYDEQNRLEIKYVRDAETFSFNYTVVAICENKYTPVVCSFINRFGGWEFLTFFKAQTNTIDVSSTSFDLNPSSINYDVFKGKTKNFNTNGNQTLKLNTGWIDEIHNETIQDLMLSETILLDNKPVSLATKQTILKTDLNDKNINYTLDFSYNFDLINNVI
jgi:hypothetical protein